MTITQTIAGVVGIPLFIAGALSGMIPKPPAPPHIVVHSIEVRGDTVVQDRTVHGSGKFTAVWNAEIRNAVTGKVVPNCEGSGSWTYAPGRSQPKIPLTEWVGNENCVLPAGSYQALASYAAGTFLETARSDIFKVTE